MSTKRMLVIASSALIASCSQDYTPKEGQEAPMGRDDARRTGFGKIAGDDFFLFGGNDKKYDPKLGGSSQVNPFLWKASLEVLSFMPLSSSDASGGVIVTDWYIAADRPNERIKLTVNITDRVLRADALKLVLHKQVRRGGEWVTATSDTKVVRDMEDLILTKARELKIKTGK